MVKRGFDTNTLQQGSFSSTSMNYLHICILEVPLFIPPQIHNSQTSPFRKLHQKMSGVKKASFRVCYEETCHTKAAGRSKSFHLSIPTPSTSAAARDQRDRGLRTVKFDAGVFGEV